MAYTGFLARKEIRFYVFLSIVCFALLWFVVEFYLAVVLYL